MDSGDESGPHDWSRDRYPGLLMLASGIQAAGPNLNPGTFGQGLQGLKFPNPDTGATSPDAQLNGTFAGQADFGLTHYMVKDLAASWYSPNQPSVWNGTPGANCFLRKVSKRWLGGWQDQGDDAQLFSGNCY